MRWLIVADIHGNLPALEAVLNTPEARSCDHILSLGDHVNFGPCSREVQTRLEGLGATLLMGNHEERLTRLNDPALSGYNWAMLRWTAAQLAGLRTDFPVDVRLGPVWCTHGTPGDPYHLVDAVSVRPVLEALPEGVEVLLSGHHHIAWDVTHQGRRAVNPGSLGMYEGETGGIAPFALLDVDGDRWHVTCCRTCYDLGALRRAYRDSGLLAAAPEVAAAALHVMLTGEPHGVLKLVQQVKDIAAAMGTDIGDPAPWKTEPVQTQVRAWMAE